MLKKLLHLIVAMSAILVFAGCDEVLEDGWATGGSPSKPSSESSSMESVASDSSTPVSSSSTYTNEEAGITFEYPSDWIVSDQMTVVDIITIYDGNGARFGVYENYYLPFELSSGDEALIEASVNELHEFISVDNANINGHPMRELVYISEGGIHGPALVVNYFYLNGDMTYHIVNSIPVDMVDRYQPIFGAIMDSYTITALQAKTLEWEYIVELYQNSSVTLQDFYNDADQKGFSPTKNYHTDILFENPNTGELQETFSVSYIGEFYDDYEITAFAFSDNDPIVAFLIEGHTYVQINEELNSSTTLDVIKREGIGYHSWAGYDEREVIPGELQIAILYDGYVVNYVWEEGNRSDKVCDYVVVSNNIIWMD